MQAGASATGAIRELGEALASGPFRIALTLSVIVHVALLLVLRGGEATPPRRPPMRVHFVREVPAPTALPAAADPRQPADSPAQAAAGDATAVAAEEQPVAQPAAPAPEVAPAADPAPNPAEAPTPGSPDFPPPEASSAPPQEAPPAPPSLEKPGAAIGDPRRGAGCHRGPRRSFSRSGRGSSAGSGNGGWVGRHGGRGRRRGARSGPTPARAGHAGCDRRDRGNCRRCRGGRWGWRKDRGRGVSRRAGRDGRDGAASRRRGLPRDRPRSRLRACAGESTRARSTRRWPSATAGRGACSSRCISTSRDASPRSVS